MKNKPASFMNGKTGVSLGIVPGGNANPIDLAKSVYKVMGDLKNTFPSGLHYKVAFDFTNFLKESIHNAYETLIIAIFLVILVVILFIGSLRASLIPIVTLPVCLIGSFIFLNAMGFTLNIISILSLILAVVVNHAV